MGSGGVGGRARDRQALTHLLTPTRTDHHAPLRRASARPGLPPRARRYRVRLVWTTMFECMPSFFADGPALRELLWPFQAVCGGDERVSAPSDSTAVHLEPDGNTRCVRKARVERCEQAGAVASETVSLWGAGVPGFHGSHQWRSRLPRIARSWYRCSAR